MPEARSRAAYERRFDELIEQALRGDRWGTLRATVLLEGLLVELAEARADARAASGGGGSERWLERVRAALAEAPANDAAAANDPLDYERLADACGMALSTLRRRFRRATGTPLHAYALQCRAAAARRLLGETDLPIKAVAARLGYRDVYFFTKQFRRLSGVPPAAYRRSRQG
jgi:iron complex transport system substrate-binding protein